MSSCRIISVFWWDMLGALVIYSQSPVIHQYVVNTINISFYLTDGSCRTVRTFLFSGLSLAEDSSDFALSTQFWSSKFEHNITYASVFLTDILLLFSICNYVFILFLIFLWLSVLVTRCLAWDEMINISLRPHIILCIVSNTLRNVYLSYKTASS